jgi:hypothetical protein
LAEHVAMPVSAFLENADLLFASLTPIRSLRVSSGRDTLRIDSDEVAALASPPHSGLAPSPTLRAESGVSAGAAVGEGIGGRRHRGLTGIDFC